MFDFFRPLLVSSVVITLMGTSPSAYADENATVSQAFEKINISSDQRALVQRMANLSCLVHLGINTQENGAAALDAKAAFAATLANLQDGNAALGLSAETDWRTLATMAKIEEPFNVMSGYLTVLNTTGTMGEKRLIAVANTANALFNVSDSLATQVQFSQSRNLDTLPVIQAMLLNIADRQNVLTEKASKEICLAQAGIAQDANLNLLAETAADFDNTMSALLNGMPGLIMAPPTVEIRARLEATNAAWQPVKTILDRATQGGDITLEDVRFVANSLENVRGLMGEAIALYRDYQSVSS